MAREKKPSPNFTLAESLQSWGRKYGQVEDSYISGLTEALRENKNLHIWATFDPLDYLPIPLLANGSKLASRVRFLTVLRNVLVFAPVALTWIAVGQATTGFQKYISQNTTGVANFLDFWQNGYDILPEEYRISSIARLDAAIILAVDPGLDAGEAIVIRVRVLRHVEGAEIIRQALAVRRAPHRNRVADVRLLHGVAHLLQHRHHLVAASVGLGQADDFDDVDGAEGLAVDHDGRADQLAELGQAARIAVAQLELRLLRPGDRLGHGLRADGPRRTGAVVHQHLLAQHLGQFGGHQAADGVGAAAGRKRHDQAKGAVGIGRCAGAGQAGQARRGGQGLQGHLATGQGSMHHDSGCKLRKKCAPSL